MDPPAKMADQLEFLAPLIIVPFWLVAEALMRF
jgi:hypothetical protein